MLSWLIVGAISILAALLLYKWRTTSAEMWLCTHAVLYLIECGDITEKQYWDALHMAEARCDELKHRGLMM